MDGGRHVLEFDGRGYGVINTSDPDLFPHAIKHVSVSCWVKFAHMRTNYPGIVNTGNISFHGCGPAYGYHRRLHQVAFYTIPRMDGDSCTYTSQAVRFNQWVHLVVTYNGGMYSIYVNGKLSGSVGLRSTASPTLELGDGWKKIGLGTTTIEGPSAEHMMSGQLAEVLIMKVDLNLEEIQKLYQGKCDFHQEKILGYWALDQSDGDVIEDSLGKGSEGELLGSAKGNKNSWVVSKDFPVPSLNLKPGNVVGIPLDARLPRLSPNVHPGDLLFIVEKHRFTGHKVLFAAASEYFSELFTAVAEDNPDPGKKLVIPVVGVSRKCFKHIHDAIYKGKLYLPEPGSNELAELLKVSTDLKLQFILDVMGEKGEDYKSGQ
eukprot:TRINITY_DN16795_c0_g1_i4.p1 TRINITY_DN16795_c0_g1~~TRINITY_DN16795_c0_g1_i4.p1  ORF type:complete len:386 (+),score=74.77 TRINITY_DN16795_c0_g1_i4:35-1159(+)